MKPAAVIACSQATVVSRHFVARLAEWFGTVYCADESLPAALAEETAAKLRPLSDLPGDDTLCVWFPRGHEWVDETVLRMIEDADTRGVSAYLNKFQWGYCPLVTRDKALGERFLRHRMPIQMISHMAGLQPDEVHVSNAGLGRGRPFYLDATAEEGRRTLRHLAETGTEQSALDGPQFPSTFEVLNHGFMMQQIRRLALFAPLEGKRVLEIGASTTNPVLARILIDDYGCDYTGLNIEPFGYPEAPGMRLIAEDIHKADFAPESFDVVFSIAVWEHIPNPLPVFDAVAGWLRPGGVHYGIFQNWMSQVGHHVFSPRQPAHLMPAWSHLTDSPEEMRARILDKGGTEAEADGLLDWVFNSPEINRVPTRDFVTRIVSGPLEVVYLDGRGHGRIDPRARAIAERHPDLEAGELSCLGLEFALRKSEFDIRRWAESLQDGATQC